MNLSPTELERLVIFNAAEFARRNRRNAIPLSHPEAVALIADEVMLAARAGRPYDEILDIAGELLSAQDVLPGVAEMITVVMIDAPFAEGTKLMAIFDPIKNGDEQATDGPGAVITTGQPVDFFPDEETVSLSVINTADRDVQVRSHSHFFEVNRALAFDRASAWGMKLAVMSGGGVRFEPGMPKTVTLTPIRGERVVFGFQGLVDGALDAPGNKDRAVKRAAAGGFLMTYQNGATDGDD